MNGGAVGDEARPAGTPWNVVVLLVGQRFDFIGPGFDGGSFNVAGRVGVMRLDEADVIEKKLVAPACTQLALFEEDADFGRGAIVIVGENLDDDGNLVGRIALEGNMLENHFLVADTGALVDGAFDGIAGDALLAGFFHRGEEAGIASRIGAAVLGSDRNFSQKFSAGLRFSQRRDFTFGK